MRWELTSFASPVNSWEITGCETEALRRGARMAYKAVFFDVGSTLIHPSPSVGEMFKLVARERGHQFDEGLVDSSMFEVDEYYDREYARDGDFWCSHERSVQIWKDMYTLLAHRCGLAHDAQGLSEDMYDRYLEGSSWSLYDDVLPCLKALKEAGYRLGIISNWDASLGSLVRKLGLESYFDVVLASAAWGFRKPDPAIFRLALEEMGVQAAEAVHVGDLPEADGAASAVGIRPVIIDRKDLHAGCGHDRIDSLVKLADLFMAK